MTSLANVVQFLPELLRAAPLTLLMTLVAGTAGLLLGTVVALARLSAHRFLAWPAFVFTLCFRGTPLLVQIYLVYYGLGELLPDTWIRHSVLWPYLREGLFYAFLVLTLNQAAYNAEVLRGAISTVPRGQIEAALSMGMRPGQILRRVTLPLAFRTCLPVLASDAIILLKATSLASTITVMELMGTARKLQRDTFLVFEPLIAAGIIYLVVVMVLSALAHRLENNLQRGREKRA